MKRKLGIRIAHILLVLLGVSFLSFLLMHISPGDPVRAMYAVSGSIPSEEILEQTREELGLNDPFFVQYGRWVSNCLRGDFGTSYSKGEAVSVLLSERVLPTIQLALLSLVIMVVLAVPIGVCSALRQNTILDYILRGTTFISISMPNFWVGLLLLYVVAMKLGWLPVVSNQMNFQRLILPAVRGLLKPDGHVVCLVKPQFEAGKEKVGKKGVVRDPKVHLEVLEQFLVNARDADFTVKDMTFSPVRGPEGNIEYLGFLAAGGSDDTWDGDLEALVAASHNALEKE